MATGNDLVSQFYIKHLGGEGQDVLTADCPFCNDRGFDTGRLIVFLKKESFFYGYFRCLNRCVPGGFSLRFARLASIPLDQVPGYIHTQDFSAIPLDYPVENINDEIHSFVDRMTEVVCGMFGKSGVGKPTLTEMQVGYNGRYLVYPYFQEDGNCYAARCVYPDRPEDYFWHGNETFSREPFSLFNVQDIQRCEQGALFICEGENNLIALKQLGFPGVAVAHCKDFENLTAEMFGKINTVFICVSNCPESEGAAKNLASRIGYKARILSWKLSAPNQYNLFQLAKDSGKSFGKNVSEMIQRSKAFSPFTSPQHEHIQFLQTLEKQQGEEYNRLSFGFPLLDAAVGGVHGINVFGGAPKVGKSTFMIQIASQMALKNIPVLYYDFENGRQKVYQRTLSRLSRLVTAQLANSNLTKEQASLLEESKEKLKRMFFYWRVINDRAVTPELMRKHIDFIRHETRNEYTVVVIDSLHKLPFNEFTERRTGIDAWLRQMESIRDEMEVSFLVISELSRGAAGGYQEEPHLGVFKGSGDIEYSADNAMVLYPSVSSGKQTMTDERRKSDLFLVASREYSPGRVAEYQLDFPFWGFTEHLCSQRQD